MGVRTGWVVAVHKRERGCSLASWWWWGDQGCVNIPQLPGAELSAGRADLTSSVLL